MKSKQDSLLFGASSQVPISLDLNAEKTPDFYDKNLLARSRTQWQFGDWKSLAQIDVAVLQRHPDRARLALLAASSRLQIGQINKAKEFIHLAKDWGVSSQLLLQMLVAGTYNSLGRFAILSNQKQRALSYFKTAVTIGVPNGDIALLTSARIREQLKQITVASSSNPFDFNSDPIDHHRLHDELVIPAAPAISLDKVHKAWLTGRWLYLSKLDNALLPGRPKRGELAMFAACGYQQLDDIDSTER
jgi:hypothetical protein